MPWSTAVTFRILKVNVSSVSRQGSINILVQLERFVYRSFSDCVFQIKNHSQDPRWCLDVSIILQSVHMHKGACCINITGNIDRSAFKACRPNVVDRQRMKTNHRPRNRPRDRKQTCRGYPISAYLSNLAGLDVNIPYTVVSSVP